MTVKLFSISFSCTANRLKVPHGLTDNMVILTKTTFEIIVSLPFPFLFVTNGTQKRNGKTFYGNPGNVPTHSEHAPCEASVFCPVVACEDDILSRICLSVIHIFKLNFYVIKNVFWAIQRVELNSLTILE